MLHDIVNKLIRILGGMNEEESSKLIDENHSLNEQLNSWRERANTIQAEKNSLIQELQFERGRNDQLIQLVAGSKRETPKTEGGDQNLEAIEMLPMSWPRLKRNLEFRHRVKKGPNDAKVS